MLDDVTLTTLGTLRLQEKRADDAHRLGRDGELGLIGRGRDVRRAVDEAIPRLGGDREHVGRILSCPPPRLIGVDVEAYAQLLLLYCLSQCIVVDEVGSCRVDQDRPRRQGFEHPGANHPSRPVVDGQVQAQDLRAGRELFDRRRVADAEVGRLGSRERAAPGDGVQPESARASRDLASDRAEARDAQRLAMNPLGPAELRPLPLARPERRDRVRNAPVDAEEQPEDQLGDRRGVPPGAVGDVDPAPARGPHVDGVELGSRAHDEVELAGLVDGLRGDLGRTDDEDPDPRDFLLERLLGDLRVVDDLDGEGTQFCDGARVQLVGDEQTHGGRHCIPRAGI